MDTQGFAVDSIRQDALSDQNLWLCRSQRFKRLLWLALSHLLES
jgi:hypothetical protein